MIKIDRDVPVPVRKHRKYPFGDMEVGDSFLLKCTVADRSRMQSQMSARARKFLPKKFVTASVDGGIRIWRKS